MRCVAYRHVMLAAVYADSFGEEPESEYQGVLARSESLAAWTAEPLGGAA